jgi:signal transduction histidine kinase
MSHADGDGIGLTIIQRIVELYGGKVWIDGAEGPGCIVHFTMPSFQEHRESSHARVRTSRTIDVIDVAQRGIS